MTSIIHSCAYTFFKKFLRQCSHYGENDGEGTVTFHRSHFTFHYVAVTMSLPCCKRAAITMAATATAMATADKGVISVVYV